MNLRLLAPLTRVSVPHIPAPHFVHELSLWAANRRPRPSVCVCVCARARARALSDLTIRHANRRAPEGYVKKKDRHTTPVEGLRELRDTLRKQEGDAASENGGA